MSNDIEEDQPFIWRGQLWHEIPRDVAYIQVEVGMKVVPDAIFYDMEQLKRVDLPDTVTRLEGMSFCHCTSLASITIPNSVETIKNYSFADCRSLTSITIPNSVETIENYSFADCSSLTSITIPNSVETIEDCAFHGCASLAQVRLPENEQFRKIPLSCFEGCTSLQSVFIPDNVDVIRKGSFVGAIFLQTVSLPNNPDNYLTLDESAFSCCPSLVLIPKPPAMSHDQWLYIIDIVNSSNQYFDRVGINDEGQRSFQNGIPVKIWPLLFSLKFTNDECPTLLYSWLEDPYLYPGKMWMSESTFNSLVFNHLRKNIGSLMETRVRRARRRPQRFGFEA